jgi:hypothetical protein
MSIHVPVSVGKVQKIFTFYAAFHDSASDCTKLTLALQFSQGQQTKQVKDQRQPSNNREAK